MSKTQVSVVPAPLRELLFSPDTQRVIRHLLTLCAGGLGVGAAVEPILDPAIQVILAAILGVVALLWSRKSDDHPPGATPVVVGMCMLLCLSAGMIGCQSVGAGVKTSREGADIQGVSPPVVLDIQDDEKRGTLTATGPSGMLDTGDTKAFFANSPPQAISFSDGNRTVSLTGAANLSGKNLKFNADDSVEIGEFTTVPSEVIKASNEGVIGTSKERIALINAQRDALIAQVQASADIAESAKPAILALIESIFRGVP